MVRAILEERKSQTRRIAKVTDAWCKPGFISPLAGHAPRRIAEHASYCPYGVRGDRLWVRETFKARYFGNGGTAYKADYNKALVGDIVPEPKWTPSIHMPRALSRLTLEVTDVRVERVRDITQQDVFREGLHNAQQNEYEKQCGDSLSAQECYRELWDSLNAKRGYGWDKNPWVWVVEFKRVP